MKQLIRVQLYRMKKSCARIWLLPACLLSVLLPIIYTWYTDTYQSGDVPRFDFDFPRAFEAVNASYMFFFCAFVMFVLAWSMKGAFDDKTICNEIMGGYSIHQIIISRLITAVSITLVVSMLCIVASLIVVWLRFGAIDGFVTLYYEHISASELWLNVLMAAFEILEAAVLIVLAMCIARETTAALAICWMVYIFGWTGTVFAEALFDMGAKTKSIVVSVLPGLAPQLTGLVQEVWYKDFQDYYVRTLEYTPLKSIGERLPLVIIAGLIWMAVFYIFAVWLLKTFELRGNDDD